MISVRSILTILIALAFLMQEATLQQTNKLEEFECSDQLNECQENLNPIYQQPAELLAKLSRVCASGKIACHTIRTGDNVDKQPGVEGLWLPLEENGDLPSGVMISLNDGKLIAAYSCVGRTKSNLTEDVLPCRLDYDKINCWFIGNSVGLNHKKFEVLINNNYTWQWTNFLLPIPEKAIIGGYRKTSSGWELLYVGRAIHSAFKKRNFPENRLLQGMVEGRSRKLFHSAWGMIETKNYYQILVAE